MTAHSHPIEERRDGATAEIAKLVQRILKLAPEAGLYIGITIKEAGK